MTQSITIQHVGVRCAVIAVQWKAIYLNVLQLPDVVMQTATIEGRHEDWELWVFVGDELGNGCVFVDSTWPDTCALCMEVALKTACLC